MIPPVGGAASSAVIGRQQQVRAAGHRPDDHHQERHEPASRHRLLVLPGQRADRATTQFTPRDDGRRGRSNRRCRANSFGALGRRSNRAQPRVLLRDLRGRPAAEPDDAEPGRAARRLAHRQSVERRRARFAIRLTGQPFPNNQIPVNPGVGARARSVLRAPEPGDRHRHRPSQLHRQHARRLHGRPLRRPGRPRPLAAPEGVRRGSRSKNVDKRESTGPLEHEAGRFVKRTEVRPVRRLAQLDASNSLFNEIRGGSSNTVEKASYINAAQGADLVAQVGPRRACRQRRQAAAFHPSPSRTARSSPSGGVKPFNILSRVVQGSDTLTWLNGKHSSRAASTSSTSYQGSDFVLRRRRVRPLRVRWHSSPAMPLPTSCSACRASPATSCRRRT